ncbi:MAG: RNA methyltransferase [Candidatus Babeliaceae bacterium]
MVKIHKEQDLIFGIHPLIELLKAKKRPIYTIYTTKPEPKSWDQIEKLLPRGIQKQYVTRDVLTRMAGTTDHQGILAFVGQFPIRKKPFDPQKQSFLVMIDGVQDTRNLGALLRSAYCTGVQGIIIAKKNGAPLNASTFKASAGLAEHLEFYEAATPLIAAQELKKAGYHLYMAALGGQDALSIDYQEPLCLVIGNEATGISKPVLSLGTTVMLAQKTPDISYNASVAAGILFFLVATRNHKIK